MKKFFLDTPLGAVLIMFAIALAIGVPLAKWMVFEMTDPKPGHTYTSHVEYTVTVLERKGDVVTYRDNQTQEVKTVTVEEWLKPKVQNKK